MVARGESETKWEHVRNLTDEQVADAIDYEDEGCFDMTRVYRGAGLPGDTSDPDRWYEAVYLHGPIVDSFRARYPDDYRQRIDEVLRAHLRSGENGAS
jgi:hypothetical protein